MDEYEKPELTAKEERIRKNIQSLIEYCLYCQPFDDGEAVWIHGKQTELYDLLDEYDISDSSKEKIVGNLFCPYCGNESFNLGFDVGLKTNFDKEVDKHLKNVRRIYGQQVKKLLLNDRFQFFNLLVLYF